MGTLSGVGHPLFSYPPSMRATVIKPRSGPGPASRSERYGNRKRSIDSGVPLGKGTGCFGGPVGLRNGTRQRGGQQSTRGILGTGTASTKDQHLADFGRGFAARREGGLL